jgi:Mrp family chromosome partitioning ATPase
LVFEEGRWSALQARLETLSATTDAIIVDAPPVLLSGEALVASQGVDSWLLCAVMGVTSGDDADALKREIAGLKQPPAGLIALERAAPR